MKHRIHQLEKKVNVDERPVGTFLIVPDDTLGELDGAHIRKSDFAKIDRSQYSFIIVLWIYCKPNPDVTDDE